MTVIAGISLDQKVWIGADSAGVAGWDLTIRADSKVFTVGPFLIGFTTSFRMGQLLEDSLVPPEHPDGMTDAKFLRTAFIKAVRACFTEGGFSTIDNNKERAGEFLLGYRGKLYSVESDFQVGEPLAGYAACGCGSQAALGSLHTTGWLNSFTPHERITAALDAAYAHSAGVRPPFLILKIG